MGADYPDADGRDQSELEVRYEDVEARDLNRRYERVHVFRSDEIIVESERVHIRRMKAEVKSAVLADGIPGGMDMTFDIRYEDPEPDVQTTFSGGLDVRIDMTIQMRDPRVAGDVLDIPIRVTQREFAVHFEEAFGGQKDGGAAWRAIRESIVNADLYDMDVFQYLQERALDHHIRAWADFLFVMADIAGAAYSLRAMQLVPAEGGIHAATIFPDQVFRMHWGMLLKRMFTCLVDDALDRTGRSTDVQTITRPEETAMVVDEFAEIARAGSTGEDYTVETEATEYEETFLDVFEQTLVKRNEIIVGKGFQVDRTLQTIASGLTLMGDLSTEDAAFAQRCEILSIWIGRVNEFVFGDDRYDCPFVYDGIFVEATLIRLGTLDIAARAVEKDPRYAMWMPEPLAQAAIQHLHELQDWTCSQKVGGTDDEPVLGSIRDAEDVTTAPVLSWRYYGPMYNVPMTTDIWLISPLELNLLSVTTGIPVRDILLMLVNTSSVNGVFESAPALQSGDPSDADVVQGEFTED